MEGLVHLETLDLNCSSDLQIPSDILNLPRLSHLEIPYGGKAPNGIMKMKSLHTLIGVFLDPTLSEDIEGLSELTNLRRLGLVSFLEPHEMATWVALPHSIEMLHDLRYLRIIGNPSYTSDLLGSLSDPFRHMKVLELAFWRMSRIPKWICGLQCLCRLELNVDTCTDEFHALGELPSLVNLSLQIRSIPEDSRVTFSAGSFPVLEDFECESEYDVTVYLAFGAGAMPKLSLLDLRFDKSNWGGATPVGFRKCTQLHPNRPQFTSYKEFRFGTTPLTKRIKGNRVISQIIPTFVCIWTYTPYVSAEDPILARPTNRN
ncbi:disease resistance protein RGA5-like [Aegilops tauschii subsp. strangulata]|nr:disease resistance protein RGA5-like [Aegilops tauschii subsp. strangulata]